MSSYLQCIIIIIIISAVVRINTYSWGSNSNVTLGHEMSRQYPEKLKMLTHNSTIQVCSFHTYILYIMLIYICIYAYVVGDVVCVLSYQAVLCKFHTVFLSCRGEVFTCGHGRGGRLGHKNEQSIIVRSCTLCVYDYTYIFVFYVTIIINTLYVCVMEKTNLICMCILYV